MGYAAGFSAGSNAVSSGISNAMKYINMMNKQKKDEADKIIAAKKTKNDLDKGMQTFNTQLLNYLDGYAKEQVIQKQKGDMKAYNNINGQINARINNAASAVASVNANNNTQYTMPDISSKMDTRDIGLVSHEGKQYFGDKELVDSLKPESFVARDDGTLGVRDIDPSTGKFTDTNTATLAPFGKTDEASDRASTFTEDFKASSAWINDNLDKIGSGEYNMHKTIVNRYTNELRTSKMKDLEFTAGNIMEQLNMTTPYDESGAITNKGKAVEAMVRADKTYDTKLRDLEYSTRDGADAYASSKDILSSIKKGMAEGKYKTGYFDSAVDWIKSKIGGAYARSHTAAEIGSTMETKLGISSEMSMLIGRTTKALYGGNASERDRASILDAMGALATNDEETQKLSFEAFTRTMRKVVEQDIAMIEEKGLYSTAKNAKEAMTTIFDKEGAIVEEPEFLYRTVNGKKQRAKNPKYKAR